MSMAERKTMTRAVKNPVKRKLTRAEKKEIAAVIQAAKGDGKPHTAQQTIPYLQMYPDGICRVTEKKYSKSLVFEDINYQLAQADDKTAIFENWCDFLNYFDASVSVQLSFINQGARKEKAQAAIEIPAQDDAFNSIRREYADMLKNQLEKGNNGLEKCKYITFSIEADNLAAAKARLSRIETDGTSQSQEKRNGSPSGWKIPCSTFKRSCPFMGRAVTPSTLKLLSTSVSIRERTLSPRPRSVLATAGRFAWGVSSARLVSLKSSRRS